MEIGKIQVSEEHLKRFRALDSALINKVTKSLKEVGFDEEPTESATTYLNQALFRLDQSIDLSVRQRFVTLYNSDGTINDASFMYFLGKNTPEFREMVEILGSYGLTIYQHLKIPKPDN